MPEKRWCYVILHTQYDDNGFIPSHVVEGEAGHSPMLGNGVGAAPWYWGKTYEEADALCDKFNAKHGITPDDAARIVASSMSFQFGDAE